MLKPALPTPVCFRDIRRAEYDHELLAYALIAAREYGFEFDFNKSYFDICADIQQQINCLQPGDPNVKRLFLAWSAIAAVHERQVQLGTTEHEF